MKNFLLLTLFVLSIASCKVTSQIPNFKTATIGCYNVENLFDTINQANNDEEYLPEGKNNWNSKIYKQKIKNTATALSVFQNPLIMGLVEVENKGVVEDLVKKYSFGSTSKYDVVHYDSPDARGIDVAMIYNASELKLANSGILRFVNENDASKPTRDIVWGKFVLGKDTIVAMVNHWPSRIGGEEKSEPGRIGAANAARKFIDSLLVVDKNYKIVLMGDLNDHPEDKAPQIIDEVLTPMITKSSGELGGSHTYDGKWDVLDHIFVSPGFLNKKSKTLVNSNSGKIHSPSFLLKWDEKYKEIKPQRTEVVNKGEYMFGYSDHLPVSIQVIVKE
ncbi:MAG: endonuclease/exonuclease/phosphatase family protein [Bacteroidota bacterium]